MHARSADDDPSHHDHGGSDHDYAPADYHDSWFINISGIDYDPAAVPTRRRAVYAWAADHRASDYDDLAFYDDEFDILIDRAIDFYCAGEHDDTA